MITPTDISNIIYKDCEPFGIAIVPDGSVMVGKLESERIVIHSKKQQPETYWKKSYVEVNICVPDLCPNEADTIRLNELERMANVRFADSCGVYDGSSYSYCIDSIGIEADEKLRMHYVNIRILFNVLNVI